MDFILCEGLQLTRNTKSSPVISAKKILNIKKQLNGNEKIMLTLIFFFEFNDVFSLIFLKRDVELLGIVILFPLFYDLWGLTTSAGIAMFTCMPTTLSSGVALTRVKRCHEFSK